MISRIVTEKLPCFFISPHLDDAVLSAGGLISYLSGKTEINIVTVFTRAAPGLLTRSAGRLVKISGFKNAEDFYRSRREEDYMACQMAGAKCFHLDFIEALWRKKTSPNFFSKIIPEFGHLYPTYRFHAISGQIHKEDAALQKQVEEVLSRIILQQPNAVVFCPAGFGGHVDHILVRQACEKLARYALSAKAVFAQIAPNLGKVIADKTSIIIEEPKQPFKILFWKDFPYAAKLSEKEQFAGCESFVWQDNFEKKKELVFSYRSQAPLLFPQGQMPKAVEEYYFNKI